MSISKNQFINNRAHTVIGSSELKVDKQKNYLFDLSYLTVLDISGDKSEEFLQGQLTSDVRLVTDIQMIQGAQCNLKGRILSLFDIINWNGLKLILPRDMIEATENSLNKTALLSRVTIKENHQFNIYGFYYQNKNDIRPDSVYLPEQVYAYAYTENYCYYHLGQGFYIFIVKNSYDNDFVSVFKTHQQLLGSLTWHTLKLFNKQFDIYPESRGVFLPHRLGLHQTKLISFDKGCYKGQEIIARTQYKATIKHELHIYIIRSENKIYSGQKLFKINDNAEIGELIDYSILDNQRYLIAVSILKEPVNLALFEGHENPIDLEQVL